MSACRLNSYAIKWTSLMAKKEKLIATQKKPIRIGFNSRSYLKNLIFAVKLVCLLHTKNSLIIIVGKGNIICYQKIESLKVSAPGFIVF